MFRKQDIDLLEGMFKQSEKNMREEIHQLERSMHEEMHQTERNLRDEIHSTVSGAIYASETRMMARMDKLHAKTVADITDFLDQSIIPQLDDLRVADASIRKFVGMV